MAANLLLLFFIIHAGKKGLYCDAPANQFRQHPLDYVEGLEHTVKDCIKKAGASVAANIKAISVDTTGSTPVAVDESGTPLALLPGFETNPHAMFVFVKDHTSIKEAAEINEHATKFDVNYLQYVGGIYSSEWFWAKLLRTLRTDEAVCKRGLQLGRTLRLVALPANRRKARCRYETWPLFRRPQSYLGCRIWWFTAR